MAFQLMMEKHKKEAGMGRRAHVGERGEVPGSLCNNLLL
jgi:hypothetical protein